jgi:hypothetical protein
MQSFGRPALARSQHLKPVKQLSGDLVQSCSRQLKLTKKSQNGASVPTHDVSVALVQATPEPTGLRRQ